MVIIGEVVEFSPSSLGLALGEESPVSGELADFEPTVTLDIPASKQYVALVRQVVSIIAGRGDRFERAVIDDLKLAVSEACANAIEAYGSIGTDSPEDHRVSIEIVEELSRIVVKVRDKGPGFDPAALESGRISYGHQGEVGPAGGGEAGPAGGGEAGPAQEAAFGFAEPQAGERGRGLLIIRALVDEATFESSREGTCVAISALYRS